MRVFTFTADSAASPDPVTLPADCGGRYKRLRIKPPSGHGFTGYDIQQQVTGIVFDIDQMWEIRKAMRGGETVCYIANDSGSGTFSGILDEADQ